MPALIVVPYQDSFQWSLSLEVACDLRSKNEEVHILDIQISNVKSLKSVIKRFLNQKYLHSKTIDQIQSLGISYSCIYKTCLFNRHRSIFCQDDSINLSDSYVRICAANVADTLRTSKLVRSYKVRSEFLRQILEAKTVEKVLRKYTERVNLQSYSVFTVNGRYSRNRMIKDFFESSGHQVKIIESGAGNSFTLWRNAQSMKELALKSLAMWDSCSDSNRELTSIEYMTDRLSLSGGDNATFKENMSAGTLPVLPKSKKICVFYSTSQIEFLYLADRIPEGSYQTQQDAVMDLLKTLGADWHVIVRRHPFGNGNKFGDDENDLWAPLLVHQNLSFIQPGEKVDSYELARKADLTAHFGSSIGADLIFMNVTPVISMGPTEWDYAERSTMVRSHSQLIQFLNSKLEERDPKSILPWAHFYRNRGVEFKNISHDGNGNLTFQGIPLSSR